MIQASKHVIKFNPGERDAQNNLQQYGKIQFCNIPNRSPGTKFTPYYTQ